MDILLPLSDSRAGLEHTDARLKVIREGETWGGNIQKNASQSAHGGVCFQEGLRVWARQIQDGFCLFDGKRAPEDAEPASGQVV